MDEADLRNIGILGVRRDSILVPSRMLLEKTSEVSLKKAMPPYVFNHVLIQVIALSLQRSATQIPDRSWPSLVEPDEHLATTRDDFLWRHLVQERDWSLLIFLNLCQDFCGQRVRRFLLFHRFSE